MTTQKKNEHDQGGVATPRDPQQTLNFLLRRRQFMKAALLGAAGFGSYSFLKTQGLARVGSFLSRANGLPGLTSFDASEILADALNFGPSLKIVADAMAAEQNVPAVFRVFYGTSHDIRNELCLTEHGNQYNPFQTLNYGGMGGALQGKVQKAPDPHAIMNAWAYSILSTGKIGGQAFHASIPDSPALTANQLAKISIIAAVGMGGSEGVHRRGAIPRVGSLEYAMMTAFSGYSPIGSVSLNTPMIDSSGGVNNPGTTVESFINSVDIPATYMSRQRDDNPVRSLDALAGGADVKAVRDQMLDTHLLLTQQLENIKRYSALANQSFMNYGARKLEGLASMMMFGDLFSRGLATVGATGLQSFDFHATDATRAPKDQFGNMLTETAQALCGVYYIATKCFEAKKDAIIHFTTCSNRNETWVSDDGRVSTLTFIIKGSENSPFAAMPAQIVLLPDNIKQVYAEGPGAATAGFSGNDAQKFNLGGQLTVGRMEGTILKAVETASGLSAAMTGEGPAGKLI